MNDEIGHVLGRVRILLAEGELSSASSVLLDVSDRVPNRFRNEIFVYQASVSQLRVDERKGINSNEVIDIRKRKLMFSMLDLLDEIFEKLLDSEKENFFLNSEKLSLDTQKILFEGGVGQVVIQYAQEGGNILDNKQKSISFDGVSGNISISAPITIADNIENSFNQLSKADMRDDIKSLLEELLVKISEVNKVVPPESFDEAQEMARSAEDLVREATSEKPRKKWYELSIEGLKEAAVSIGSIADPVLSVVGKIATILV